jgi:plastocyanin
MKPRHTVLALLAAAAIGALLAGCGGGDDGSATAKSAGSPPKSASGSDAVRIDNFAFSPATLTVAHGTQVTITNDDSTAHTATADDGNSFDTGDVESGSSKAFTVSKPGTYAYHCSIHPFMHGKLVVR